MQKTIILHSENPTFSDLACVFKRINLDLPSVMKVCATPLIYARKIACVDARKAVVDECVVSRTKVELAGRFYWFNECEQVVTDDDVKNGAMVITNQTGEVYLIKSKEEFDSLYERVEDKYQPKCVVRLFARLIKHIILEYPDRIQYCPKGSYVCIQDNKAIFAVTNVLFDASYRILEIKEIY